MVVVPTKSSCVRFAVKGVIFYKLHMPVHKSRIGSYQMAVVSAEPSLCNSDCLKMFKGIGRNNAPPIVQSFAKSNHIRLLQARH
jgi:hypothetical protein